MNSISSFRPEIRRLVNSASRTPLIAAAGLFVGGVAMASAKAADLSVDCCADLQERVADLYFDPDKGHRVFSRTITGQVTKVILWWDDRIENRNSSTHFTILGEAKVPPNVKIGYEIMVGSAQIFRLNPDGNGLLPPLGAPMRFWVDPPDHGRIFLGVVHTVGAFTWITLDH